MRSELQGRKHQKLDTVKLFIGLVFGGFFILSSTSVSFAANIDYSDTKDFFHDIKVGESAEGDLSTESLSNPYTDAGYVKGYKIEIDKSADLKKLEFKVQSCAVKISIFCAGDSFDEVVYILNSKFQPVDGEYKQKETIDFSSFKMPENGVLYFLVGSEKNTSGGQYVVSIASK